MPLFKKACKSTCERVEQLGFQKERKWWAMTDSNRRHPRCKRGALPTELIARREAEAVSAASVAVIYAYQQKTARAERKIFLIFFQTPMIAGRRLINRMWKTRRGMMVGKGEG